MFDYKSETMKTSCLDLVVLAITLSSCDRPEEGPEEGPLGIHVGDHISDGNLHPKFNTSEVTAIGKDWIEV